MGAGYSIEIDGRLIGEHHPPYVIAELSANHQGSLETALAAISAAKAAGADAVKLQTYLPDTITLDIDAPGFRISGGLWGGRRLYELYEEAHLPWEWHAPLFARARSLDLTIFSSPFDDTAVHLLESLDAPAYKIASFETVDLALIRRVAATGKPLIVSTGMADATEIAEAVAAARSAGCRQLVLLHCVSGYPAPPADYKLRTLVDMRGRFDALVGLSDHTIGNATAIAAVALGAVVIEKHFTLSRGAGGPDAAFSIEPEELSILCRDARTAWEALGEVDYGLSSSERDNAQFRRSLYVVRDIAAGERVEADAIRSIRPGFGAAPKHLDALLGRRARRALKRGTPVALEDFE